MNIWEILIVAYWAMRLGVEISHHGDAKELKYNGWGQIIVTGISFFILYKAGLFN